MQKYTQTVTTSILTEDLILPANTLQQFGVLFRRPCEPRAFGDSMPYRVSNYQTASANFENFVEHGSGLLLWEESDSVGSFREA